MQTSAKLDKNDHLQENVVFAMTADVAATTTTNRLSAHHLI